MIFFATKYYIESYNSIKSLNMELNNFLINKFKYKGDVRAIIPVNS